MTPRARRGAQGRQGARSPADRHRHGHAIDRWPGAAELHTHGRHDDLGAVGGPPWYWGDKNPLAAYVGKSVTVAGEAEQGGTELDVDTVDGTAIRAPGKPPWAGGPWAIGPTHPGWKDWMAGGKPGKGQDKDKAAPTATP